MMSLLEYGLILTQFSVTQFIFSPFLRCLSKPPISGLASSNLPDGKTILVMWYQFPSASTLHLTCIPLPALPSLGRDRKACMS